MKKVYIYEDIEADDKTGFTVPILMATIELSATVVEQNKLDDLDSHEATNFLENLCRTYKTNYPKGNFWWEVE